MLVHIRMLDKSAQLQQEAVGGARPLRTCVQGRIALVVGGKDVARAASGGARRRRCPSPGGKCNYSVDVALSLTCVISFWRFKPAT